jgi:hypothetical protein
VQSVKSHKQISVQSVKSHKQISVQSVKSHKQISVQSVKSHSVLETTYHLIIEYQCVQCFILITANHLTADGLVCITLEENRWV